MLQSFVYCLLFYYLLCINSVEFPVHINKSNVVSLAVNI